ncbi:MAG: IclR family transcriptional regulator C-terminal domain-containing protein, partial [Propionicimonas sp.]|nr:IclR family transcriptional regulator C-terminal domain-containing protein [Propionicimonas sp.]
PGLWCVAAIVHDVEGNAAAAISASIPESRWGRYAERQWAHEIVVAASELSGQLGYRSQTI